MKQQKSLVGKVGEIRLFKVPWHPDNNQRRGIILQRGDSHERKQNFHYYCATGYGNSNISTYPGSDGDYISAIEFTDDSVSTKEGITLGTAKDRVIASYGDNYTQDKGSLIYTKGNTRLTFLMEEDTVSSINYEYVAK